VRVVWVVKLAVAAVMAAAAVAAVRLAVSAAPGVKVARVKTVQLRKQWKC
jgi:hypothetical protein